MIKKFIRKIINLAGYDIKPLNVASGTESKKVRTTIEESYLQLRHIGFYPSTVVDIGVASGTPELYRSFSDAFFLLIEPLKKYEGDMKSILKKHKGTYVLAAAGAQAGTVEFNLHDHQPAGSSLLKETMGIEADGHAIQVPMIKVDDVVRENNLPGPYLIKVDVQGAELEALAGAQKTIAESEAIVLEVSLFQFLKGGPQLHDVVSFMKNKDFVAYDIIPGWNRPLDNALGQVDIVFVKDKGMFRTDHSYSTIDHMKSVFGDKSAG